MKNYKHINKDLRIEIASLQRNGHSVSDISKQLNLHRSTIYRELGTVKYCKYFYCNKVYNSI